MKQLVISPSFPFSTHTFITREIAETIQRGHEVIILSPDDGDIQGQVSAKRFNIGPERIIYANILKSPLFTMDWLRFTRILRKTARREEYGIMLAERRKSYFARLLRHPLLQDIELIHAHFSEWAYNVALPLSELLGIPFTFTVHDSHLAQQPSHHCSALQEKASAITFPSKAWRDIWLSKTNNEDRLHILPNAVSLSDFSPPETLGINSGALQLITIGRLLPHKRIADGLHAVRRLLDLGVTCSYTVIGSGPEEAALRHLAQELDIEQRVTLLGAQPHERVVLELQKSDIYLHPSEKESFGVAVIEAMAVRLPVVAARSAGTQDTVVPAETGQLYSPGDLDSLVQALASLAQDIRLREAWGKAGRARVERLYSWNSHMTVLCDLWDQSLLAGKVDSQP